MGVSSRKPLPFQGGTANRLMLQKVEVLENNRGKTAQSRDVDAFLLSQLHGVQHLAPRCFKAAQHLWHKAGIDIGPFDGFACQARDFKMLYQLRRCTAPNI